MKRAREETEAPQKVAKVETGQSPRRDWRGFDKYVVLDIISMTNELRLRDKLVASSEEARVNLVRRHCKDKRFMTIALRVDRSLLRYASKELMKDSDLVSIALQPVLPFLETMPLVIQDINDESVDHLTWQDEERDKRMRTDFCRRLCVYLSQLRPFAPLTWFERFESTIPKIERFLYVAAVSKADYLCLQSIRPRLLQIYSTLKSNQQGGTTTVPTVLPVQSPASHILALGGISTPQHHQVDAVVPPCTSAAQVHS